MKKYALLFLVMIFCSSLLYSNDDRTPIAKISNGNAILLVSESTLLTAFNEEFQIDFEKVELIQNSNGGRMLRALTRNYNDSVYSFPWGLDEITSTNGETVLVATNNPSFKTACCCHMYKCYCNPTCTACDPNCYAEQGAYCEDYTHTGGEFDYFGKTYQSVHFKNYTNGRIGSFY